MKSQLSRLLPRRFRLACALRVYVHAALLALWHALEAEGVAASAPKWMQAEFGVDLGVSSNEWVTVRWPV